MGTYGHIGIFDNGTLSKFESFDQNFPKGSLCHLQKHSYKNVLGWLRFKRNKELEACMKDREKFWKETEELKKTISTQATDLRNKGKELKSWIKQSNEAIEKFETADEARKKWHGLYKTKKTNLETCKIDCTSQKTKITKMKETSFETAETKILLLELVKRILKIKCSTPKQ